MGSGETRNAALNALMSISFDNTHNCLLIARTPGMIQSLLKGLHTGSDESRDGVCGVLCNVIYYNAVAAHLVLSCDNVLAMLNGLCKSPSSTNKYLGVSVIEACCHQEHAVPLPHPPETGYAHCTPYCQGMLYRVLLWYNTLNRTSDEFNLPWLLLFC